MRRVEHNKKRNHKIEAVVYNPKFNEENDKSILHGLIKSKPLGMWSTLSGGKIVINHIPFVLHEDRGEWGTLVGHVARSNSIWKEFSKESDSVVVFQGEQAYITPSWYPSKHKHGKAVPTWNYVVVHAHGIPKKIEDGEWIFKHLKEMTTIHESEQSLPWKLSDAPAEYIDKLAKAIVGIEIPINKIIGKWKIGQNKSESDQMGVVAGLKSTKEVNAQVLASELSQHIESKNKNS